MQITANVQNVAVRLDALRELLPSSLGDVPLRTQLAELGILSEVQVLYKTMEIHDAEMKVQSLWALLLAVSELSASVWGGGKEVGRNTTLELSCVQAVCVAQRVVQRGCHQKGACLHQMRDAEVQLRRMPGT